jgi:hypothetical protein
LKPEAREVDELEPLPLELPLPLLLLLELLLLLDVLLPDELPPQPVKLTKRHAASKGEVP